MLTKARGPFSTSNFLYNAAAQFASGGVFVAAWVYVYPSVTHTIWSVCNGGVNDQYLRLVIVNGDIQMHLRKGGSVRAIRGGLASWAWNFVAGSFLPGSHLKVWRGNASTTQGTAWTWPTGLNRTAIGVRYSTTLAAALGSNLAALAMWTSEPSASEIAEMANRHDFRQYNQADLSAAYPLMGSGGEADLVGSFNFTEAGTLPEAGGPRLQRLPLCVAANVGLLPAVQRRT